MKKRTKTLVYIGIVIAGLFSAILFLGAGGVFRPITLRFRLDKLLHHTDHQALLAACRTLMKEGYRGQYLTSWPNRHPDVEKFPKEILALKPTYVWVHEDGRVRIEFLGGMSHNGVVAYAEDFKKPYENFKGGHLKLIDGLWIYSD